MTSKTKMLIGGILSASLFLSCIGCGSSVSPAPTNSNKETITKDPIPSVTSTGAPTSPHLLQLNNLTAAPVYPEIPKCPQPEDYENNMDALYEAQWQWQSAVRETHVDPPENAHDLDPFMEAAMEQYLSGGDNAVCSPLNIYFALAMLAETTDGSSRQQILDLLGHEDIQSLREQANQLWRAHYLNDGETSSLLANSLWLDDQYSFHRNTLDTLAKEYFASVFTGDLGTADMNKQLATWLDSQTGGLLSQYTQNISLDPATIFCLAATAYFCADWNYEFSESATTQEVFYAKERNVTTDFMHQYTSGDTYYTSDHFAAISLSLSGNHNMWFILPDEGYTPEDLLAEGDYYTMISDPYSWDNAGIYAITMSIPKFDISSEQDLISGLNAMGITDVFDPAVSHFTPITDAILSVGSVSHAARVAIDEEGVIAAAYTVIELPGAAAPRENEKVEFILNRPFLFVITGSDDLPLFAGVVAEP